MQQLKREDYQRIIPLLENCKYNQAIIYSVIEDNHPGDIFVDDLDFPTYALVVTKVNYMFVVGKLMSYDDAKAIYNHVFNKLLPKMIEKEVIIFSDEDYNRDILDEEFKYKGLITIKRNIFEFDINQFKQINESNLPKDSKLVRLDSDLAKKALIDTSICDFNKEAFGYAIIKGNDVISVCYSIFISNNEAEIDIKTKEEYRRLGYGIVVAKAFIKECINRNIKPQWSCWPYNEASIFLAKKLGFKEGTTLPAHFWSENM